MVRSWRLALAGGALVAVVAIVSRGSRFHDRRHNDGYGRAAAYLLAGLVFAVMLFGLILAVLALRRGGMQRPPRRSFWRTILLTVVLIGAIAVASPLIRRGAAQRNVSPPLATIEIASSDCGLCSPPLHSPGESPWWIVIAAGVLVSALLVVGARGSKGASRPTPVADREQARWLFDASLDDLLAEPDPRKAITMAYGRLLDGLAACGLAHIDTETPYEHLARALAALAIAPEALSSLTSLFSEARFSDHVLTSVHKELAIAAFRAARESLTPLIAHTQS